MSLQTQLSESLGSWCRWQEGKMCRFSIKSRRCLHLSSPDTHTIIYVVIVQCWLGTQDWWQFTNGTCPCTSCLQSWICSVLLEHACRADVLSLSLQQTAWPYSNGINSSACLALAQQISTCANKRDPKLTPCTMQCRDRRLGEYPTAAVREHCRGPKGGWRRHLHNYVIKGQTLFKHIKAAKLRQRKRWHILGQKELSQYEARLVPLFVVHLFSSAGLGGSKPLCLLTPGKCQPECGGLC